MPEVEVPPRYRGPTGGRPRISVDAGTVRGCIDAVEADYPGFRELVFEADGSLRRYVRLFLNGDALAADEVDARVGADDRVQILAARAGG